MKRLPSILLFASAAALAVCLLAGSPGGGGLGGGLKRQAADFGTFVRGAVSSLLIFPLAEADSSDAGVSVSEAPQAAPDAADCWGETGIDGCRVFEYGKTLLLSADQRSCYDQIAAAVLARQDTVTVKTSLEPASVEKIYEYYRADHPENFYLGNVNYSCVYTPKGAAKVYSSYTFRFTYTCDAAAVAAGRAQLGEGVRRILADAEKKTGEEARERAIHDALVAAVQYDTAAADDSASNPAAYTVVGALVDGRAVCDGYSKALKLLLDSAGFESIYLSGTATNASGGGPHAWNMARIDGKWFYVDATFDDPILYNSKGQPTGKSVVEHTYFNFESKPDHVLGIFDSADPFSAQSENYEVLPAVG